MHLLPLLLMTSCVAAPIAAVIAVILCLLFNTFTRIVKDRCEHSEDEPADFGDSISYEDDQESPYEKYEDGEEEGPSVEDCDECTSDHECASDDECTSADECTSDESTSGEVDEDHMDSSSFSDDAERVDSDLLFPLTESVADSYDAGSSLSMESESTSSNLSEIMDIDALRSMGFQENDCRDAARWNFHSEHDAAEHIMKQYGYYRGRKLPMFRITKLSKVFMAGYIRLFSESDLYIPDDIQSVIIRAFNLYFVRLKYDIPGDDQTPSTNSDIVRTHRMAKRTPRRPTVLVCNDTDNDMNMALQSMILGLERRCYPVHGKDRRCYARIWMPFAQIRTIYPVGQQKTCSECLSQKSGRYCFMRDSSIHHQYGSGAWYCQSCCERKMGPDGLARKYAGRWGGFGGFGGGGYGGPQYEITKETFCYSMDDIMAIEEDPTRWVQVPPDCLKWSPLKLDKLVTDMDKDGVLEFGVQFYNPFIAVSPNEDDQKWRRELKVGDIVDVKRDGYRNGHGCYHCSHCQCDWYEAVIRYIQDNDECPNGDRLLSLHFIGLYVHDSRHSSPTEGDAIVSAMDMFRIKKRGTIVGPNQMLSVYWRDCEQCHQEETDERWHLKYQENAREEWMEYELLNTPDVKAAVDKCIESTPSSGKEKYKRRMKARGKMLKRKEMKKNRRKRDCRRSSSKRGNRMGGRSTNRNNGKFGMDLSPDFVLC